MNRWTLLGALLGAATLPSLAFAAPTDLDATSDRIEAAPLVESVDAIADAKVVVRAAPAAARAAAPAAARAAAPAAARAAAPAAVRASAPAVGRTTVVHTGPAGGQVTVTRPGAVARPPAPSAQAGVRVQINMNNAYRGAPPPPPPAVAPPPPPVRPPTPYGTSVAPPPPSSVVRPPRTTVYYGWRSPTVYVYPRVYTSMWGFWWWAPPGYTVHQHYYEEAPSRPQAQAEAPREKPEPQALHVGDTSFGVWGGVHRGAYLDGSVYSDPGLRFSFRHRSSDHLGVDFSGGYYGTMMYPEEDRNGHRVDVPLQLSGTLHLFPTLPVQLYGLAGVTADFRDFQKVGYTEGGKDFYYDDGRFKDSRFGPHIGAGAEIMLGPDISIHADARWTYYTIVPGQSLEQTYPTAFSANAGMSFYF